MAAESLDSETWLSDTIETGSITFENYSVPFRKDRVGDSHGGVLVYVKTHIPAIRRYDLEVHGIECIWIELRVSNKKLLFGTFYRPPNSLPIVLTNIENSIGLAYDTESSNSLIDLFLLSSACKIAICGVGEPFLDQNVRYHCPIFCCLNHIKPKTVSFKRTVWQFDTADYDGLRREASQVDWDSLFHNDIDTYTENIIEKIRHISQQFIPHKQITVRQKDPPWMHNEIRKHIRKRKRMYDGAKITQNQEHWKQYKQIRNKTVDLIRNAKTNMSIKLCDKLKSQQLSPTDYWKTLKQFIKSSSDNSQIPVLKQNDIYYTDNVDKANLLNTYFQAQTITDDSNKQLLSIHTNQTAPLLDSISITQEEVAITLQSLTLGKAAGPDNINNRVLKELSQELAKPLCDLFNYSLSIGKVPTEWKLANVCAIFKKNDPKEVSDYRPISLLSTISKVMEKIIHKHVFNFFVSNNAITSL
ncbi:uncharacterized protein LOC123535923 [Mercenaria mercenaria]|uniref:uncharacterized protein LOC123535923 n=1 Tax=Mercenaria mercenaria TaxID=6596 RepID=UPI00234EBE7B|nr:uncharacterized protein LOC123535923 [Mercenaria mercenaria]